MSMSTQPKPVSPNWDHIGPVLDDARERWMEKERESAHERSLVLVKDSSKEKDEESAA